MAFEPGGNGFIPGGDHDPTFVCAWNKSVSAWRNNRELSQGDAASCATQEATNLDGTAFFGPLCLTSAFANERRSSAEFSQLCVYDVTIAFQYCTTNMANLHKNRTCNCLCTTHVMHERIPSPRKVSDWLILQLRRGFQYDPVFGDYRCGFEGYAGFQARNYANCRNLHTTRTI